MTTTPLHHVLGHIGKDCPKCGIPMIANMRKQLAQCYRCDAHGYGPVSLLMHSGMTFIEAEQWLNQTSIGAPIQDGRNARAENVSAR